MIHIERFYFCFKKTFAIWITRTPEPNVVSVPHVNVHGLTAHRTLRTVFYAGFIRIVDNELAGADLTDISPFARSSLAEVIPRIGTATGTSNARFSFHEALRHKRLAGIRCRAGEADYVRIRFEFG
jgi:hypothetical protein